MRINFDELFRAFFNIEIQYSRWYGHFKTIYNLDYQMKIMSFNNYRPILRNKLKKQNQDIVLMMQFQKQRNMKLKQDDVVINNIQQQLFLFQR